MFVQAPPHPGKFLIAGDTSVDLLWLADASDLPAGLVATAAPPGDNAIAAAQANATTAADGGYLSSRLRDAPVGESREALWGLHRDVYRFVDPEGRETVPPAVPVLAGAGFSARVTQHTQRLHELFRSFVGGPSAAPAAAAGPESGPDTVVSTAAMLGEGKSSPSNEEPSPALAPASAPAPNADHGMVAETARRWVVKQGWAAEAYIIRVSEVQSCPLGLVTVDVLYNPPSATEEELDGEGDDWAGELLRRSRVLELEPATGKVDGVLAFRGKMPANHCASLPGFQFYVSIGDEWSAARPGRAAPHT